MVKAFLDVVFIELFAAHEVDAPNPDAAEIGDLLEQLIGRGTAGWGGDVGRGLGCQRGTGRDQRQGEPAPPMLRTFATAPHAP